MRTQFQIFLTFPKLTWAGWTRVSGLLLLVLGMSGKADAQTNLPIGVLSPGETITITYDVQIANSIPPSVPAITNRATLSGSNFVTVLSDDPRTPGNNDPTITPLDLRPQAVTLAASGVSAVAATLNGTVNPNHNPTTAYFEYGTTVSYGTVTAIQSLPATNISLAIAATLTNLTTGQAYHYRIACSNVTGMVFGADAAFTPAVIYTTQLIQPAILPDGSFQFGFTNSSGGTFTVLSSTNPALPIVNWSVAGVPVEISPGQFQFTDPTATNSARRFYLLRWP